MKRITTLLLILFSGIIYGQDLPYDGTIKFALPDSAEGGYTFNRKAVFEAMIYNQRTATISLQWRIKFMNAGQTDLKTVGGYSITTEISNSNYVVSATGAFVGGIDSLLSKYGKPSGDSSIPWLKLQDGRYDLSTACMGEYDYWVKSFDNNQKLAALIKAYGLRVSTGGQKVIK